MKIGIGIFAKTIGHSRVKTRLAAGIGQKQAEEFYSLSVKAVEEVVKRYPLTQNHEIIAYWARPSGKYDISTRGLSLGTAMHKVATKILDDCDAYILIGTDTPQISQRTIDEVIGNLTKNHKRIIFGPSSDGGFYLMAGSFVPSIDIMVNVKYSQDDTLKQLLSYLKDDNIEYIIIEELADVDVIDDLANLRKYLEDKVYNNEDLLESQHQILKWLIKRNLG